MGGRIWVESEPARAARSTSRRDSAVQRRGARRDGRGRAAGRLGGPAGPGRGRQRHQPARSWKTMLGRWGMRPVLVGDGAGRRWTPSRAQRRPEPVLARRARRPHAGHGRIRVAEEIKKDPTLAPRHRHDADVGRRAGRRRSLPRARHRRISARSRSVRGCCSTPSSPFSACRPRPPMPRSGRHPSTRCVRAGTKLRILDRRGQCSEPVGDLERARKARPHRSWSPDPDRRHWPR